MASVSDASTTDDISSDIYSLSDQQLAANLEFIQEIGYGNWGSVWSCRSRVGTPAQTRRRLAVKLVHRTSSRTTPARVRSLWNEMKVVRSLKDHKHPAIIDFHSFIITPSYALITMEFLPRLVPVEVREPKARVWFESLLDGVAHLHAHGIVHNDIKPANILLTRTDQPVMVDFGFAERYDTEKPILRPSQSALASPSSSSSSLLPSGPKAPFESNLAYGTPEYLSPERAKGYIHDTRKSDVWALGVTFFEIVVGRTPFELEEGEEFTSKEDLERYWNRTNNDIWVGTWNISLGLEKLLRAMLRPDPDQRLTAREAQRDPYFTVASESEIVSAIRIDVQSKKISQTPGSMNIGSPASFVTAKTHFTMAPAPTPSVPRSKLGALQTFIGKTPPLPITTGNSGESLVPSCVMNVPNQQETTTPLTNGKKESKARAVPSLSKSFLTSHSRSKSGITPVTPQVQGPSDVTNSPTNTTGIPNTCEADASVGRIPRPRAIATASQAVDITRPTEPVTLPRVLKLEPILCQDSRAVKAPSPLQSSVPPSSVLLKPLCGKENGSGPVLRPKHKGTIKVAASGAQASTSITGATPTKAPLRVKNRRKEEAATPLRTRAIKSPSPVKASQGPAVHETNQLAPSPMPNRRPLSQIQNTAPIESDKTKKSTKNGLKSFGHSVRKSIDKTAEKLSKMSMTATGSLSKRNTSKAPTTELQKSWNDLEKDPKFTGNLSAVVDESVDQSAITVIDEPKQDIKVRVDRMTRWIKDVERVVQDTRQEFEREAEANESVISRRSSSRLMTLEEARKSADVVTRSPSLPPPRRRNTVSSVASNGRKPAVCDYLKMPNMVQLGSRHLPSSKHSLDSEAGGASTFKSSKETDTTGIAPSITVPDTSVPHISTAEDQLESEEQSSSRHYSEYVNDTSHASKPDPSAQSSPPRSVSQVDYDRELLATQGIVKMGKGFSYIPNTVTSFSPSFYQMHHSSTEYIVPSDHGERRRFSSIQGPKGGSLSKSRGHWRGGIFATLRGREQDELAHERGTTRSPSYLQSPYSGTHIESRPTPLPESHKTLSIRMKKAFFRVVSTPMLSKPSKAGIAS